MSGRGTRAKDKCKVPNPKNPEWLCDRHKAHEGGHQCHPYIQPLHRKILVRWPGRGRAALDPDQGFPTFS